MMLLEVFILHVAVAFSFVLSLYHMSKKEINTAILFAVYAILFMLSIITKSM